MANHSTLRHEHLFIISSNARASLLDHLTASRPVPTDDEASWVSIESNALKLLVTIHSGIAAEWASLISSHAKPQWRYLSKKSCPVVRGKRATASARSR
ncbi:hypothetical protein TNCV_2400101 [Trichonephila clavipes]|uniref:Uncharacterized protein n=1 Tax=Trichonephila clavipes TaxID=2585209 RepID=A0A8X6T0D3_TRICX|nr:hypothetical protein TNCV_2400101 [Trichonephila clavipes]